MYVKCCLYNKQQNTQIYENKAVVLGKQTTANPTGRGVCGKHSFSALSPLRELHFSS